MYQINPKEVKAIQSLSKFRSLITLLGYNKSFTADFSSTAKPLHELLSHPKIEKQQTKKGQKAVVFLRRLHPNQRSGQYCFSRCLKKNNTKTKGTFANHNISTFINDLHWLSASWEKQGWFGIHHRNCEIIYYNTKDSHRFWKNKTKNRFSLDLKRKKGDFVELCGRLQSLTEVSS